MKKLILALLLFVSNAHALELVTRTDYLNTRNNGSDDAYGIVARLEQPVWREFSVAAEFDYHARQKFPSINDSKGSFGSLYGYGLMGNVIFRPLVNWKFSPYFIAGAGYFWWDFKENPFLQDNHVTVDVDPSIAFKTGLGFDFWLNDKWALNFEASYFNTKIDKLATDDNGTEWNILGDELIGNEQWNIGAGLKYKF